MDEIEYVSFSESQEKSMSLKKIITIAQKYIENIERAGIPVSHAYIFGSQIKGKAHPGSDIDLCVISPVFGKDRQKERIKLMNLRDDSTDIVEPHPYSLLDFSNRFDPLSSEIQRTGITI